MSITRFFLLLLISQSVLAENEIGKAISLEGSVQVKHDSKSSDVKVRGLIYEGDVVTTGKRSSARFLLNDDTIIDLKESSQFGFQKLNALSNKRDADFALDFGRVRASVNKKIDKNNKYQFKTKATVFAVRGTDFTINAPDAARSDLTVFEGTVAARDDAREDAVAHGFERAKTKDGATLSKLSQAQIEKIFSLSRTEDANFSQNIIVGDLKTSRNSGLATLSTINKITVTPKIQIPHNAVKVPGISRVNAVAVSPGALNYVISNIGVTLK
ncbi:MAG: FecR family protein [Pseudobdellovibrio sp.]